MYLRCVVWGGNEECVALFGEAENEGFIGGGGASREDDVVGVESDIVASNLRHEIDQCLFESREAMVILEESEFTEDGFSGTLKSGHVGVLIKP